MCLQQRLHWQWNELHRQVHSPMTVLRDFVNCVCEQSFKYFLTSCLLLQMLMNAHSRLLVMQMLCAPTRLVPTHVPAAMATLGME